ncbi:MAG: gamma-glutamyltransferase [Rhizobiales bacterium]|nr:gamma-glutamyltransferase [Hyphomicrobiales bacterium]
MHGRRPTITSLHGMVAAAHPHAAQAGARILASGGNAFDAAAAVGAALNVVEPFMSSLAGEGLATMWVAAEQRVRVLDFVPPIPSAFPVDRFRERAELERGPLPVGTPGNLAGWCELAGTYGRKPLAEIFAPAIALAEDGFALAEFGAEEFVEQAPLLARHPALYEHWARAYLPGGAKPAIGMLLRQPDLGATLRALATKGPEHLYGGELGARIVAHLASLGGILQLSDLTDFKPVWRDPLPARYRDLTIHVPPPPCEGFQFLLTLRILEGLDLKTKAHNSVDHLDLVYRAIRLAAGIRIAHNNPPPDRLADIMSDASVARLRARVLDGTPISGPTEQWMAQAGEDPAHTTSFSIADREGNMVCVTQSLGSPFGSGVVVPGTGLCLNNFLYWADVQPGSPNRSRPGGALLMCMSPSISTRDGKPVLALGTPGSYGILQTQAQAFVHHIDFGLPLQEAIEAPRARLWDGRFIQTENRVAPEVVAGLAARGHAIEAFTEGWTMKVGGMQAVSVDPATGLFTGAADPRRDGYVATP